MTVDLSLSFSFGFGFEAFEGNAGGFCGAVMDIAFGIVSVEGVDGRMVMADVMAGEGRRGRGVIHDDIGR